MCVSGVNVGLALSLTGLLIFRAGGRLEFSATPGFNCINPPKAFIWTRPSGQVARLALYYAFS